MSWASIRLVFAAINANHLVAVSVQNLCQRLDRSGFACSSRAQKQEHTCRSAKRGQSGLIHLDARDDSFDRLLLPDNLQRQQFGQVLQTRQSLEIFHLTSF